MKRVLMIANDFPPIGGAGVQRSLYFAKYLEAFGWTPIVLTVKDVAFPSKDPTLLAKLPAAARILRTESFELRRLVWLAQRLKPRRARSLSRGGPGASAGATNDSSVRSRELGRVLRRWLFVPDDRMLWAPFAIPKALQAIKKQGAHVIFATTPCYSSGVIGQLVSRISGIPLVLDLRDPWSRDPYLPSPTPLHSWLNSRFEAAAIVAASRVIVISEQMRKSFQRAYPQIPSWRFVTITNGFDVDELAAVAPSEIGGSFVMAYSGSLYAHHRPALRAFCEAWSRLTERDSGFARAAELWLVGRTDPEIHRELESWPAVKAKAFGYRPHVEALGYLKRASALLLLVKDLDPEHDVVTIPGKLFEYVGAGSPILMIGPEGDAADIVRETAGHVHRERELEAIAGSLAELYSRSKEARKDAAPDENRNRYDRKHLTGLLAGQLDAVLAHPSRE